MAKKTKGIPIKSVTLRNVQGPKKRSRHAIEIMPSPSHERARIVYMTSDLVDDPTLENTLFLL